MAQPNEQFETKTQFLKLCKCAMCGQPLPISQAVDGVVKCKFCDSEYAYTVPKENSASLNYLDAGSLDLDKCKFSDAYVDFTKAIEADPEEPEAYWGRALATERVQYLKDLVNNRLQPICYDVSSRKFSDNTDYQKVLELATSAQQDEYKKKAQEIDYIRNEFLNLKNSGLKYDTFICVKVSDGEKLTKDYKDAQSLYKLLSKKGYKPFFSEEDLTDEVGADYEAHILYALYSADSMLVVCSNRDYLQTKWVKNEYTRYLQMIEDESKDKNSLAILYRGQPIERLDGKKGKLQGVDLNAVGSTEAVEEFVKQHTLSYKKQKSEEAMTKAEANDANTLSTAQLRELLKQAEEKEAKKKAEEAKRKADEEAKRKAEEARKQQEEQDRLEKERKYENANSLMNSQSSKDIETAREIFLTIPDWKDSNSLAEKCIELCEKTKKDEVYSEAIDNMQIESAASLLNAKELFETIPDWKDSSSLAEKCIELCEKAKKKEANEKHIRANFEIEGNILKKYIGNDIDVTIPACVEKIGEKAFENCNNIASVNIPLGITSIDDSAFTHCSNLTNLIIPDSVILIGNSAFSHCSNLTNVIISKSITSIGWGAFAYCNRLRSIAIPNGITELADLTFDNCSSLTDITIPESVTSIGWGVFSHCSSLTSITLPENVKTIGKEAFTDCVNLASITIPNNTTSIGSSSFNNCTNLKSIIIPNKVTEIDFYTFNNCENLENIIIPESVTFIIKPFLGCKKLTIYCEANKKPKSWDDDWNVYDDSGLFKKRCKVVWGYKK